MKALVDLLYESILNESRWIPINNYDLKTTFGDFRKKLKIEGESLDSSEKWEEALSDCDDYNVLWDSAQEFKKMNKILRKDFELVDSRETTDGAKLELYFSYDSDMYIVYYEDDKKKGWFTPATDYLD